MAAAEITLITETEFRSSQYGDIADNVSQLSSVIGAAEEYIQQYIDRRIAKATYTEVYDQRQTYLFPRQYPVRSITSLKRRVRSHFMSSDTEWHDLDVNLIRYVHPDAPILEYLGEDLRDYEVQLVYEAGYDPVPADIKRAVIIQTTLESSVEIGVFGADDGKKPGFLYMQDHVHQLICPYKRLSRFV